ncbi:uncharacterized protein LOC117100445 [Anneissia japonica]|uniref:uncharacterized protein LOC117100445 n=1 Tax=Anneissia japonica TaxID=1529436 RepID=UPI0014255140|nr:uncharacterized protein LOC117100445 [Anneissia japonica]XP_033096039.1 uncharacterized protein LOC117100445 [Anneissia japonica]
MYAINCVGYATMHNPNWSILMKATEGAGFFCTMVVGLAYIAQTARPRCQAAVTFMFSAAYTSLGFSVGSEIGGLLTGEYGVKNVFYMVSGLSASVAIFIGMFDWIYSMNNSRDEVSSTSEHYTAAGHHPALTGQDSCNSDKDKLIDYGSTDGS